MPKALKFSPKSNKSLNLVTLLLTSSQPGSNSAIDNTYDEKTKLKKKRPRMAPKNYLKKTKISIKVLNKFWPIRKNAVVVAPFLARTLFERMES